MTPHSRWPNLFVVGVLRGGTTTLWGYLQQHPDIYMSPVKEPHYFTKAGAKLAPRYSTEREYLGLFAGAHQPLRGEASASYFADAASPAAIKGACPDAKILVIFRDPIERAYSHYWHAVSNGHESRSFAEAVRAELADERPDGTEPYIRRGFYSAPLRRFLDLFGDNVRVLFLEELSREPAGTMRGVFDFLRIAPEAAGQLVVERRNAVHFPRGRVASRILRSQPTRRAAASLVPLRLRPRLERLLLTSPPRQAMDADLRAQLADLYQSDEETLESILQRPLPWRRSANEDGLPAGETEDEPRRLRNSQRSNG